MKTMENNAKKHAFLMKSTTEERHSYKNNKIRHQEKYVYIFKYYKLVESHLWSPIEMLQRIASWMSWKSREFSDHTQNFLDHSLESDFSYKVLYFKKLL